MANPQPKPPVTTPALREPGKLPDKSACPEKPNPDLVGKLVQATLKGIAFSLNYPNEAFEICKKYVEGLDATNQEVQKNVFMATLEFWKTDKPGFSKPEAWENMQKVLLDMGMLTQPVDLNKAYSNAFIE